MVKISRLLMAGIALIALIGAAGRIRAAAPTIHTDQSWLVWSTQAHTASLILVAGYNNAGQGFNFNGYSKGRMVVSVPQGYRISVTFRNAGEYPHSAVITPYRFKEKQDGYPLAFRASSTPDAENGYVGKRIEHFQFTASKVGTYAIVCGVAGHEPLGMWEVFRVTKGGVPSLKA